MSATTALSARMSLLALAALLSATQVEAAWCRDRYTGRLYRCLGTGARIAIGVCVGVGVFLIIVGIGLMRRRRIAAQNAQFRPPPPNTAGVENPYANNPPPPVGTYGNYSGAGFNQNPYGGFGGPDSNFNNRGDNSDLPPPPNSYQGQGQTGLASQFYGNDKTTPATDLKNNEFADHSYEYEQAQQNAAASPPGYDVPSGGFAAPSGPPPGASGHSTGQFNPPSGPPPAR